MSMSSTDRLIDRIRAEYEAMPGLKLTRQQACRLWAADEDSCGAALEKLIANGFLHRTGTGKYIALPRSSGAALAANLVAELETAPIRCPHCRKLNTMQREHTTQGRTAATAFRCVACQRIVSFGEISA
jgi:phage FluMu protein Com